MRRHYLVTIFTLLVGPLLAQTNISFDRITTKEGLAHNQVRAIVQDKNGFMWFGTTAGLQRYDGKKFVTFLNDPNDSNSLVTNRIRSLLAAPDGGVWIGTFGGGLSYYNNGKFKTWVHDRNDPNSLSDNSIEALTFDAAGNLWIGTRGGGLARFRDGKFTNFKFDTNDSSSISHNAVFSLLVDSQDRIWVGTYGGGLNLFQDGKFIRFNDSDASTMKITGNFVISLEEDENGVIWMGTWQDGYSKINAQGDISTWSSENFKEGAGIENSSVLTALSMNGKMYQGSWGAGLNILGGAGIEVHKNTPGDASSLGSNYIESIFADNEGYIWIGTYGGGVNRVSFSNFITFRNRFQVKSLNSEFVTDLLETSDGDVYIGTLGGGLNKYSNGTFEYFLHDPNDPTSLGDPSNSIWSLTESDDGSVWVATQHGLEQLKNGRFFHHRFKDRNNKLPVNQNLIYSIENSAYGGILFGTWDGRLVRYHNGEYKVLFDVTKETSLEANHPGFSIFEGEDGVIWACFESYGLVKVSPDGKEVQKYFEWRSDKTNVPEPRGAIQSKFDGIVWAGTSLGLYRVDPVTNEIKLYDENAGLVNNNVAGVMEDKNGIIWVTTLDGMSRFDPKSETFENFDELDGLQGNQFVRCSWFVSPVSEKIYAGGTRGFNVFHPDSINIDRPQPRAVVTGMQVLYKPVSPGEGSILSEDIENTTEINLSHEDKVFSFDFSTINYNRLYQQYNYAYYLENYEESWNFVGKRTYALYNNIPPGEYYFKVVSSKTGADWDNPVKSIKIIIHPPWWSTWWARVLAALLLIIGSYSLFVYRLRNIRRRNRVLKRLVDKRTAELSHSNDKLKQLSEYKDQMTSMIVHDLKNPLNTVFNMTEKPEVVRAAKRMLNLITNMLDIQKFEETSLKLNVTEESILSLTEQAIQEVSSSAELKSIAITNNVDKKAMIKADVELIVRVIVNLLTNAIKFSPKNSVIELTTLELPETWQISVKDNGPGIPEDAKKTIFEVYGQLEAVEYGITPSTGLGLAFCKQAVKAHNGFIGVYSKSSKGSIFYFTLPKSQQIEKSTQVANNSRETGEPSLTDSIELSKEDREYLSSYVQKLRSFEIYEFTKISRIIDEIENRNENLKLWKQTFKNAVYSSNSEKYNELIEGI